MKKEKLTRFLAATALLTGGTGLFIPSVHAGQAPPKITVCHKGITITVAETALPAHLAHGDLPEGCEAED